MSNVLNTEQTILRLKKIEIIARYRQNVWANTVSHKVSLIPLGAELLCVVSLSSRRTLPGRHGRLTHIS